jgi:predicted metal-dependent enzyme (double-stranded beta helix superfamily)
MLSELHQRFNGLSRLDAALAVREARPLIARVARLDLFGQLDLRAPKPGAEPTWRTLAEIDGCVLQLFVWPVGARTPIHDHTSWGVYACVAGQVREQRYVRLDAAEQAGVAHLRQDWRAIWTQGEQSTLLPYAGGIHRVSNAALVPAVSLHLYGPRTSDLDGRDYDALRDRVCDRQPDLQDTNWLARAA